MTVFAFISDFGTPSNGFSNVRNLITKWNPEYVITGGDNVYLPRLNSLKLANSLKFANKYYKSIMDYFQTFIAAAKFYPIIGNHDVDYNRVWFRNKFPTLFQNVNYYSTLLCNGNVEIYALSSGYLTSELAFEPAGNTIGSQQYNWFKNTIAKSKALFKIVILHHPPYTSDPNRAPGYVNLRWEFEKFGVNLVLSGHCHNYERFLDKPIPYVVAGIGGQTLSAFLGKSNTSKRNAFHGALKFTYDDNVKSLTMQAYTINNTIFDAIVFKDGVMKELVMS